MQMNQKRFDENLKIILRKVDFHSVESKLSLKQPQNTVKTLKMKSYNTLSKLIFSRSKLIKRMNITMLEEKEYLRKISIVRINALNSYKAEKKD